MLHDIGRHDPMRDALAVFFKSGTHFSPNDPALQPSVTSRSARRLIAIRANHEPPRPCTRARLPKITAVPAASRDRGCSPPRSVPREAELSCAARSHGSPYGSSARVCHRWNMAGVLLAAAALEAENFVRPRCWP